MNSDLVCVSIVLSDMVICERGTNKNTLVGSFNNFNAPRFPFVTPPFFVTIQLTNFLPNTTEFNLTVRVEERASGAVLTSAAGQMKLGGPAELTKETVLEIPIPLGPFLVPKAGHYDVVVLVNNEQAGKRLLTFNALTAQSTIQQ